jgi:hypothetical protein
VALIIDSEGNIAHIVVGGITQQEELHDGDEQDDCQSPFVTQI